MRAARLRFRLSLLPLALMLLFTTAACSDAQQQSAPPAPADSSAAANDSTLSGSVLQILRQRQRFGLFTTLIDSAGLAPALRGSDPYTVFAATDSGLDKLPEGMVEELLLPENRDRLTSVLGYHIHRGKLAWKDVQGTDSISTLTRRWLPVAIEGGRVMIGEATMTEQSLTGSNGRIYTIGALLLPPLGSGTVEVPAAPTTADTSAADTSVLDTPASDRGTSSDGSSDGSDDGENGSTGN